MTKVVDNFDPAQPEVRDVPDVIAQSWLLQPARFKLYVEPTPQSAGGIEVDGKEYIPAPVEIPPVPEPPPTPTPEVLATES